MQTTVHEDRKTVMNRQLWRAGFMLVAIGMLALLAASLITCFLFFYCYSYWEPFGGSSTL